MKYIARNEAFVCQKCHKKVRPILFGGSYRNHCPYCLHSKHVDTDIPGDRKNNCLGLMKPTGVFTRRSGEDVLVHKCEKCHFERYNRIAGDDDFELVTQLNTVPTPVIASDRRKRSHVPSWYMAKQSLNYQIASSPAKRGSRNDI